jgi:hypothetical protein
MDKMRTAVVIPTNRESKIKEFLTAWEEELRGTTIVVIEDNASKTFNLPSYVWHFAWDSIDRDLGEHAWIIPRRTSCIRSYGFWKLKTNNLDMIITMDDDVIPSPGCTPYDPFITTHYKQLLTAGKTPAWEPTLEDMTTRGFPISNTQRVKQTFINHGMWEGDPDLWAIDKIRFTGDKFFWVNKTIPTGLYYPMCSMNLAFDPLVAPLMYFLLMDSKYPYSRLGDIWCGVISKKICDHLGLAVRSGKPSVFHHCASDTWKNLVKESRCMKTNELFWEMVDSVVLTCDDVKGCYVQMAHHFMDTGPDEYFRNLGKAMGIWISLW